MPYQIPVGALERLGQAHKHFEQAKAALTTQLREHLSEARVNELLPRVYKAYSYANVFLSQAGAKSFLSRGPLNDITNNQQRQLEESLRTLHDEITRQVETQQREIQELEDEAQREEDGAETAPLLQSLRDDPTNEELEEQLAELGNEDDRITQTLTEFQAATQELFASQTAFITNTPALEADTREALFEPGTQRQAILRRAQVVQLRDLQTAGSDFAEAVRKLRNFLREYTPPNLTGQGSNFLTPLNNLITRANKILSFRKRQELFEGEEAEGAFDRRVEARLASIDREEVGRLLRRLCFFLEDIRDGRSEAAQRMREQIRGLRSVGSQETFTHLFGNRPLATEEDGILTPDKRQPLASQAEGELPALLSQLIFRVNAVNRVQRILQNSPEYFKALLQEQRELGALANTQPPDQAPLDLEQELNQLLAEDEPVREQREEGPAVGSEGSDEGAGLLGSEEGAGSDWEVLTEEESDSEDYESPSPGGASTESRVGARQTSGFRSAFDEERRSLLEDTEEGVELTEFVRRREPEPVQTPAEQAESLLQLLNRSLPDRESTDFSRVPDSDLTMRHWQQSYQACFDRLRLLQDNVANSTPGLNRFFQTVRHNVERLLTELNFPQQITNKLKEQNLRGELDFNNPEQVRQSIERELQRLTGRGSEEGAWAALIAELEELRDSDESPLRENVLDELQQNYEDAEARYEMLLGRDREPLDHVAEGSHSVLPRLITNLGQQVQSFVQTQRRCFDARGDAYQGRLDLLRHQLQATLPGIERLQENAPDLLPEGDWQPRVTQALELPEFNQEKPFVRVDNLRTRINDWKERLEVFSWQIGLPEAETGVFDEVYRQINVIMDPETRGQAGINVEVLLERLNYEVELSQEQLDRQLSALDSNSVTERLQASMPREVRTDSPQRQQAWLQARLEDCRTIYRSFQNEQQGLLRAARAEQRRALGAPEHGHPQPGRLQRAQQELLAYDRQFQGVQGTLAHTVEELGLPYQITEQPQSLARGQVVLESPWFPDLDPIQPGDKLPEIETIYQQCLQAQQLLLSLASMPGLESLHDSLKQQTEALLNQVNHLATTQARLDYFIDQAVESNDSQRFRDSIEPTLRQLNEAIGEMRGQVEEFKERLVQLRDHGRAGTPFETVMNALQQEYPRDAMERFRILFGRYGENFSEGRPSVLRDLVSTFEAPVEALINAQQQLSQQAYRETFVPELQQRLLQEMPGVERLSEYVVVSRESRPQWDETSAQLGQVDPDVLLNLEQLQDGLAPLFQDLKARVGRFSELSGLDQATFLPVLERLWQQGDYLITEEGLSQAPLFNNRILAQLRSPLEIDEHLLEQPLVDSSEQVKAHFSEREMPPDLNREQQEIWLNERVADCQATMRSFWYEARQLVQQVKTKQREFLDHVEDDIRQTRQVAVQQAVLGYKPEFKALRDALSEPISTGTQEPVTYPVTTQQLLDGDDPIQEVPPPADVLAAGEVTLVGVEQVYHRELLPAVELIRRLTDSEPLSPFQQEPREAVHQALQQFTDSLDKLATTQARLQQLSEFGFDLAAPQSKMQEVVERCLGQVSDAETQLNAKLSTLCQTLQASYRDEFQRQPRMMADLRVQKQFVLGDPDKDLIDPDNKGVLPTLVRTLQNRAERFVQAQQQFAATGAHRQTHVVELAAQVQQEAAGIQRLFVQLNLPEAQQTFEEALPLPRHDVPGLGEEPERGRVAEQREQLDALGERLSQWATDLNHRMSRFLETVGVRDPRAFLTDFYQPINYLLSAESRSRAGLNVDNIHRQLQQQFGEVSEQKALPEDQIRAQLVALVPADVADPDSWIEARLDDCQEVMRHFYAEQDQLIHRVYSEQMSFLDHADQDDIQVLLAEDDPQFQALRARFNQAEGNAGYEAANLHQLFGLEELSRQPERVKPAGGNELFEVEFADSFSKLDEAYQQCEQARQLLLGLAQAPRLGGLRPFLERRSTELLTQLDHIASVQSRVHHIIQEGRVEVADEEALKGRIREVLTQVTHETEAFQEHITQFANDLQRVIVRTDIHRSREDEFTAAAVQTRFQDAQDFTQRFQLLFGEADKALTAPDNRGVLPTLVRNFQERAQALGQVQVSFANDVLDFKWVSQLQQQVQQEAPGFHRLQQAMPETFNELPFVSVSRRREQLQNELVRLEALPAERQHPFQYLNAVNKEFRTYQADQRPIWQALGLEGEEIDQLIMEPLNRLQRFNFVVTPQARDSSAKKKLATLQQELDQLLDSQEGGSAPVEKTLDEIEKQQQIILNKSKERLARRWQRPQENFEDRFADMQAMLRSMQAEQRVMLLGKTHADQPVYGLMDAQYQFLHGEWPQKISEEDLDESLEKNKGEEAPPAPGTLPRESDPRQTAEANYEHLLYFYNQQVREQAHRVGSANPAQLYRSSASQEVPLKLFTVDKNPDQSTTLHEVVRAQRELAQALEAVVSVKHSGKALQQLKRELRELKELLSVNNAWQYRGREGRQRFAEEVKERYEQVIGGEGQNSLASRLERLLLPVPADQKAGKDKIQRATVRAAATQIQQAAGRLANGYVALTNKRSVKQWNDLFRQIDASPRATRYTHKQAQHRVNRIMRSTFDPNAVEAMRNRAIDRQLERMTASPRTGG